MQGGSAACNPRQENQPSGTPGKRSLRLSPIKIFLSL